MYYDCRILHVNLPISGLTASESVAVSLRRRVCSGVVGFQRISYSLRFDHVLSYYGHLFGIVVSGTSVLLNRALIKQHDMLVLCGP